MMTNNELRDAMEKLSEVPESYIMKSDEIRDAMEVKSSNRQVQELTSVDVVNHPPHYQSADGLEVIDVIKAFTAGLHGIYAVDTGNAIKYICRWSNKNGVEDLKKARWYINHLIHLLEEDAKNEVCD